MYREYLKRAVCVAFMVPLFPAALVSGFGRVESIYTIFAHSVAWLPGIIGDYCRTAYYVLTLRDCSIDARVRFGSYFPHSQVTLKSGADIGAYCIIGCVTIGSRTKVASCVQMLSGQNQHSRGPDGRFVRESNLEEIHIGDDCWIGSGAILMADVGEGSNVGAGSVVGSPVPPWSVVMGNPARILRSSVSSPVTAPEHDSSKTVPAHGSRS